MASRTSPEGRRRQRRAAVIIGAIVVACFSAPLLVSPAGAALTDDPRAIPHDGIIGSCPAGSTVLLGRAGGIRSNRWVVTTLSSDGRYVTLSFDSSLTKAGVVAYVKGGPAYNEYQIEVGTTDTTLLRSPLLEDGSLPTINHLLVCQTAPPPTPVVDRDPEIFVAYVDNFHDTSGLSIPYRPSPWQGDPNVVYVGCAEADCGKFDSGAIRLDNPTTNTATRTLTAASVVIGACTFAPWTTLLPQSFAPGQRLILTQTGQLGAPMPAPCRDALDPQLWDYTNFDTSERAGDSRDANFYNCDGLGAVPVINLTFDNGSEMAVNDTGKILNTGGSDSLACFGTNEAAPWTQIA